MCVCACVCVINVLEKMLKMTMMNNAASWVKRFIINMETITMYIISEGGPVVMGH